MPPIALDSLAGNAVSDEGRNEVAFILDNVTEWQTLAQGVRAGVEVVRIDSRGDGLAQMADYLARKAPGSVDAIHLFGHGSNGAINLGSLTLNSANLNQHGHTLARIGAALSAEGDFLLYGCAVAASGQGDSFMADLAALTGVDVAASDDNTGAARLGGDWVLERFTGAIETASAITAEGADAWNHELPTADFTTSTVAGDYSSVTTTVSDVAITVSSTSADGVNRADIEEMLSIDLGGLGNLVYKRNGMDTYTGGSYGDDEPMTVTFDSAVNLVTVDLLTLNTLITGNVTLEVKVVLTPSGGSNSAVTYTFTDSVYDGHQTVTLNWTEVSSFTVNRLAHISSDTESSLGIDNIIFNTGPAGPTVTDTNISVSTSGSGTGGAYKVGDTVTARWNNTTGGENQSGITGVTMDFSAFGGGPAVTASNDGSGNWSASYTISAGTIDAGNRNVSVSATDGNGTTSTADSSNLTVDNQAPGVGDARISISGASGTGGAYKIGDT
ncbi:DUF4347 domain-containing protein, partial [Azonexus sp.]|uniref:DUF4347 domain-containing protein n=1 Tax=Azonexus sp. TaxID=1872668 RepID=UPI0027B9CB56